MLQDFRTSRPADSEETRRTGRLREEGLRRCTKIVLPVSEFCAKLTMQYAGKPGVMNKLSFCKGSSKLQDNYNKNFTGNDIYAAARIYMFS